MLPYMETSQLTKCTRNTVASEMTYIVSGGAYLNSTHLLMHRSTDRSGSSGKRWKDLGAVPEVNCEHPMAAQLFLPICHSW